MAKGRTREKSDVDQKVKKEKKLSEDKVKKSTKSKDSSEKKEKKAKKLAKIEEALDLQPAAATENETEAAEDFMALNSDVEAETKKSKKVKKDKKASKSGDSAAMKDEAEQAAEKNTPVRDKKKKDEKKKDKKMKAEKKQPEDENADEPDEEEGGAALFTIDTKGTKLPQKHKEQIPNPKIDVDSSSSSSDLDSDDEDKRSNVGRSSVTATKEDSSNTAAEASKPEVKKQEAPSGLNRKARRRLQLIEKQRAVIQKRLGITFSSTERNEEVDEALAVWIQERDRVQAVADKKKADKAEKDNARRKGQKIGSAEYQLKKQQRKTARNAKKAGATGEKKA
ncbi:hypothetical protein B0T26DRAFT_748479 [Lasiosphaeria miniovina]|uniref:Uncharacterized protein n=1 Tax=Lasiosphaeria miniovina TaxID=1954250 RepID=A0AA40B616_9PEZI|nr:uncharacterized protein B0T26DRAFT_748479 [Lasiosphaeria miniovina]KAK0728229.1 hypothetical protein B0T26DRAFT_748479 [Lasiosphaeria miniovina]